uniref:CULLIN_2 domain-containing protein n=1 Tax=Macrostomum lignano TaxID=282301 RepID=A0A1I8FKK8_9PLAT
CTWGHRWASNLPVRSVAWWSRAAALTEDADAAADSPEAVHRGQSAGQAVPALPGASSTQPKLHPFDSNLVARRRQRLLMTEELLASVSFNVHGFRDAVVSCLLQETVKAHLAELGETVKQLLIDSDSHGLSLFFSVMIMVDGAGRSTFWRPTSMYIEACVSQQLRQLQIDHRGDHRAAAAVSQQESPVGHGPSRHRGRVELWRRRPALVGGAAATRRRRWRTISTGRCAPCERWTPRQWRRWETWTRNRSCAGAITRFLRERLLSEASEQLSLEAETFALDSFTQLRRLEGSLRAEAAVREYESRHSGRRVSLVHSFGSGLLAFWPRQRAAPIHLRCSAALSTGMKQTELAFYLHHLSRAGVLLENSDSRAKCSSLRSRTRTRGGGGRRRSRCYAVNDGFDSDAKQVNLMILQQQQGARSSADALRKLDQRMKEKKVQCAIVTDQLAYLVARGYVKFAEDDAAEKTDDSSIIEYIP